MKCAQANPIDISGDKGYTFMHISHLVCRQRNAPADGKKIVVALWLSHVSYYTRLASCLKPSYYTLKTPIMGIIINVFTIFWVHPLKISLRSLGKSWGAFIKAGAFFQQSTVLHYTCSVECEREVLLFAVFYLFMPALFLIWTRLFLCLCAHVQCIWGLSQDRRERSIDYYYDYDYDYYYY